MRIFVESYGCALNRGEAGEFIAGFQGMGHVLSDNPESADYCVIFTCGVIETTERHMLKRIRELSAGPKKQLMVCGCLSIICPDEIREIVPNAILVGPAGQLVALKHLGASNSGSITSPPNSIGILPIATGCKGACSYCITRMARGKLTSRSPEELAGRLRTLVGCGAVEIQLCAQDTGVYGMDLGLDLADLIESLEEVDGDFMLRIGMMNPASLIGNLESTIRAFESPKVFKFLHLPVQSGSNEILKRMSRNHTADDFRNIVKAFREKFPGMALSTDMIIGFPGETDDDFQRSMDIVRETKPDIINVTRFSARPGTEAHKMGGKVPGWKAKGRSREMSALRFSLTADNYTDMKGKIVKALSTERRIAGTTFLRTIDYRPVVVKGELELGRWYNLKITGKTKTHLNGKMENTPVKPKI